MNSIGAQGREAPHEHALGRGEFDERLRLVVEELGERLPDATQDRVVVRENDSAGTHPWVEVIQAAKGAFIQIDIEVGEGKLEILRHVRDGLREDSLVVVNVWEWLKVGLHGFHAAGIEVGLGAMDRGVMLAGGGKTGKGIEQVKGGIPLALANHSSRTALEDPDLGNSTRLLALCAGDGMENESLIAGEQPFALAAGLPDEPECVGILVKAEGEFLDSRRCADEQAFEEPATEVLDEIGLEPHIVG